MHRSIKLIELSHDVNFTNVRQPFFVTENVILKTKSHGFWSVIQATTEGRIISESVAMRIHSLGCFLNELNIIDEVRLSCEGAFWPLDSFQCLQDTTGTYCALLEVWMWRLFSNCDASCYYFQWRIFFIESNVNITSANYVFNYSFF